MTFLRTSRCGAKELTNKQVEQKSPNDRSSAGADITRAYVKKSS